MILPPKFFKIELALSQVTWDQDLVLMGKSLRDTIIHSHQKNLSFGFVYWFGFTPKINTKNIQIIWVGYTRAG